MKNILIIGAGNLGLDLEQEALRQGFSVMMASRMNGFSYPDNKLSSIGVQLEWADTIFCTVGAGSVEQAEKDFGPFADLHIRLPMELIQKARDHHDLVFFSTDYLHEPGGFHPDRSLYAISKATMERCIEKVRRPKTHVFTIGSLYGNHKPANTLPGKILSSYKATGYAKGVQNKVRPTPTDWAAKEILKRMEVIGDDNIVECITPKDIVSCYEFAWHLTDGKAFPDNQDQRRPNAHPLPHLGKMNNSPSWQELWDERASWWKETFK